MRQLNLKKKKMKNNSFGISLHPNQELFINRHLKELSEKAPPNSKIDLKLEKRKSCIKGFLTVNSLSASFCSMKVNIEPIHTFLELFDDVEAEILDWKRNQFSDSLYNQLKSDHKFVNYL